MMNNRDEQLKKVLRKQQADQPSAISDHRTLQMHIEAASEKPEKKVQFQEALH